MPPSAMTVTPALAGHLGDLEHGGDLRDADAGDDPGGADRSRADADLDGVGAGVDERLGRLGGGDVAGDDRAVPHGRAARAPSRPRSVEWPWAVSTTRASTPASISALARSMHVGAGADGGGDPQAAVGVLGGVGEVDLFWRSLMVMRPRRYAVVVDDRQLLDLVVAEQLLGLGQRGAHRRGHQARRRS